ncbi:uncharacterized protein LOC128667449 [Microplitis demolitor]|uniref:uncharacterized protein LOC128667449 n=1 Tax=Microplitis demolitor TaxID=69319 RepID=UPI00235B6ADD|nr:uncharacterized protein LOC128667449 [Microplitis demolitor]
MAKSLERSSKDLKPSIKSSTNFSQKSSKNLKGPRRQPYSHQLSTGEQHKTTNQLPKTSSYRQSWKKQGGPVSSKKRQIFSDASLTGWSACCGTEKAHGFWNNDERKNPINFLELQAAFFGLKCFATSYISSKDNITADYESRRLESETEYSLSLQAFTQLCETFGYPEIDLFASRINTKCYKYVSWKKVPGSIAIDAFTLDWSKFFFYAFPPFALIPKGTSSSQLPAFPGGRNLIKQMYSLKEISSTTSEISIASLSDSSLRQYESALKKWWNFCHLTNTSVFTAKIPDVLRFLTSEVDKGASYGSVNSLRSAVALILGPELSENPDVKRFCKGVSKIRPPRPKYDSTWNPKIFLDFVSKWFPNDDLSLQHLSYKVVVLLALTTGHRIQTLAAINLNNIDQSDDRIEIKITSQLKTSGPKSTQPNLILPFFTEDTSICVASTLLNYLKRTKDFRGSTSNLFISWKKPHNAVSTQTLSRWIKEVLHLSGIDTSKFTAYSTRHASTSSAKKNGVNIDLIQKTAGWTQSSQTFARFYDRKIIEDCTIFAKTVLSTKK